MENILDITNIRDEDGKIRAQFSSQDSLGGVPHGRYSALRENGQLLLEITYRQGTTHGPYVEYWSNGKVACKGQFNEGKQEGCWSYYREDGSLMETIRFSQGKEARQR